MIQILFSPKIQTSRQKSIRNSRQNSQLIHDPLCFQTLQIHSIYRKKKIHKPVDPKTYSPASGNTNMAHADKGYPPRAYSIPPPPENTPANNEMNAT